MTTEPELKLKTDISATLIPQGEQHLLRKGTSFTITHRLGGNFTILCEQGMFRVDGKLAEALGETLPEKPSTPQTKTQEGSPSEDQVWEQLKKVFDPEIPVNIVDLGLIYSMELIKDSDNSFVVNVAMTLTAPGCGMGPTIAEDARQKILEVSGIENAKVELVWDPPWSQDMISEEGKMELGLI